MALQYDHLQTDTIAAIATAMSEAGIGIIRISGPDAAAIGSKLYRTPQKNKTDISLWRPGTIRFGYIVEADQDGKENVIDEVMLSWMKSPHSYTTEDTVEINTHGGMFLMNRILALVLQAGARMAEPGEFTKRAFLGGRIDLARAEAVMDLISSRNEFARKTSAAQLQGAVSSKVKELREKILYEIAFIESALDDPENYTLEGYTDRLMGTCEYLEKEIKSSLVSTKNSTENENMFFKGITFQENTSIIAYYTDYQDNYLRISYTKLENDEYTGTVLSNCSNDSSILIDASNYNKHYMLNDLVKLENNDIYFAASSKDKETLYITVLRINGTVFNKKSGLGCISASKVFLIKNLSL